MSVRSGAGRRIGVFGGTFDPPHIGHLVAAVDARRELELDVVLLVVANAPWQKLGTRSVSPAADRLAMVEAAVHDAPGLQVSDVEIARGGLSYTADTLEAVRHAREQKSRVLAVCNTNGSQIPRESDAVVYMHAGPEIGVASTKAFLGMVVANYLVGLALAQARGLMYADEIGREFAAMEAMPAAITETLARMDKVRALGKEISDSRAVLFLGRHVGYPVALEGALKLKELAYIHAEGFAAGELKHGPIALIEEGLPVFCVVPPRGRDQLHDKMISAIQEIRARGARTIVIAEEGDVDVEPYADVLFTVPVVPALLAPLVTTVPLQVFACHLAMAKGHDVDQPRNLAKSVTVE